MHKLNIIKQIYSYLKIWGISLVLITTFITGCNSPNKSIIKQGEIAVKSEVVYPKFRTWNSPSNGEEVKTNSPSFQWPIVKNASYSVRVSSSKDFTKGVIEKENIPFAFYNPHQKLDEGIWYWQLKANNAKWGKVNSFKIAPSAKDFVTPNIKEVLNGVAVSHPRVLVKKEDLNAFHARVKDYKEIAVVLTEADKYLNSVPPKESAALPSIKGKNDFENKKIALKASKRLGVEIQKVLTNLSQAYLISNDIKYFNSAKPWVMEALKWDPKGLTRLSNFGDAGIMNGLAISVDTFWDLFTPTERKEIIAHVSIRANGFYNKWRNYVESRSSSMHVWQHIMHNLLQTSLVLLGETEDAELWLEYIYELWIAQSPKMGETDGAWFNGTGYFSINTVTLYDVTAIFNELTNVDFRDNDWYKNNMKWLMYAFPPNSFSDGFCNGSDGTDRPRLKHGAYADIVARSNNDPLAYWYSLEVAKSHGKEISDDLSFLWYRIQHGYKETLPEPIKSIELPQAAQFPEIGVAYMHTTLPEIENNLMFSMRSSPFGSLGHTHAEQNGFNIAFGGKRLFYNSGYRATMGDPHFLAWYKHTQGHNAILIDGEGQPFNAGAYGWIPRFIYGDKISYAVGDASNAYSGSDLGENIDLGMKRFRRHFIMLRPSIIVIYDELVADHDAEWSWLIHNDSGIKVDAEKKTLLAENELANAQVSLFSSTDIDYTVSDKFSVPIKNWVQNRDDNGQLKEFKNQWHFKGISKSKTPQMRYLAIIQVKPKSGESVCEEVVFDASTKTYSVGDWNIKAEMNASKLAKIKISDNSKTVSFVSSGTLEFDGKNYNVNTGSSKLIERIEGKNIFQEVEDEIPAAIKRTMKQ